MGPESDFMELVWENGQLSARGRSSRSSDSHNIQNQCQEGIFKDKKSSSLQEALSVLYPDFDHNEGSSHASNSRLQRVPDQAPAGDGEVRRLTSLKHHQVSVPTSTRNQTLTGSANQGEIQERRNFSVLFKTLSSSMARPKSGLSAAEAFKGEDNEHLTGRGSCKLGSKEAASAMEERQVRFPASLPDSPGNNVEQLAASSCGASNNVTHTLKRIREESDSYTSEEDIPEEEHNCLRVPDQLSKRRKGSRVQEVPEKRRRAKINKRMRALQKLIPKCSKLDKASLLDDAINYLKALQLQVQMMAMGSRMFHPGMMLLAPAQHLGNYSGLANFMPGMRMQMFGGCNPLHAPHSLFSGVSSPAGVPEAQPDNACFPSQALPISGTHSPFFFSPQMASPQYAPASASGQIHPPNSSPLPSGKKPK